MTVEQQELAAKVLAVAREGKITCAQARQLAEELSMPYEELGQAVDQLKIKICSCQLGCF